jgi:hypothetical protein
VALTEAFFALPEEEKRSYFLDGLAARAAIPRSA